MEPVFVGSLSAQPDMWQSEGVNHMEFETTSRSLKMVTKNSEVPQLLCILTNSGQCFLIPKIVLFVLSHT